MDKEDFDNVIEFMRQDFFRQTDNEPKSLQEWLNEYADFVKWWDYE